MGGSAAAAGRLSARHRVHAYRDREDERFILSHTLSLRSWIFATSLPDASFHRRLVSGLKPMSTLPVVSEQ